MSEEQQPPPRNRKHQIIWLGKSGVWVNDITVTGIHTGPLGSSTFGYAIVGDILFLVQHDVNETLPVWHVRGWVRTS